MSYRPGGSANPSAPPAGPNNYNAGVVRARRRVRGIPWVGGCGLLVLGFGLGIITLFLAALLYFGTPATNQPLPRTTYPGTPDLIATLSETYLNSTVTKYLKANPLSVNSLVGVKDIALKIRPSQQVDVVVQLGNALVDFNVTVSEALGVKDGKLVLSQVGQPSVGNGKLPVSTDAVVNLVNGTIVEPEINRELGDVVVNGRKFKLVDVSTTQGLISIKFNAQ